MTTKIKRSTRGGGYLNCVIIGAGEEDEIRLYGPSRLKGSLWTAALGKVLHPVDRDAAAQLWQILREFANDGEFRLSTRRFDSFFEAAHALCEGRVQVLKSDVLEEGTVVALNDAHELYVYDNERYAEWPLCVSEEILSAEWSGWE